MSSGGSAVARRHTRRRAVLAVLAGVVLAGCGGGSGGKAARSTAPTATPPAVEVGYAAQFGGLEKLTAAARKEGRLNVIGLADDWANYRALKERFAEKYGIEISSRLPAASSRAELAAARELRGTGRAPDVFDLSAGVAAANLGQLARYKVTTWGDVPDPLKEASGRYVGAYGGVMSVGYDAKRVPPPATLADLTKPVYRGRIALNGEPHHATSAAHAVLMAALGNGGSAEELGPGTDFFARLKQDGNLAGVQPTEASISAGRTPVVLDWDFTNVQRADALPSTVDWRVVVLRPAVVGSYYVQAINIDAPHPAAARLWQEFLLSDEGQNLWLGNYLRPSRAEAMRSSGALDLARYARLPGVPAAPVVLPPPGLSRLQQFLTENWTKSVG